MTTIIILLILIGISIAQLTGNGLFEKAKIAKEESKNAQDDEEDKIAKYSNEIDNFVSGHRDVTDEEIDQKITTALNTRFSETEWTTLVTGIQYKKKNGYVTVIINGGTSIKISENTGMGSLCIGTLPAGFRPSTTIIGAISYGGYNSYSGAYKIDAEGKINVCGQNAREYISATIVFPVN